MSLTKHLTSSLGIVGLSVLTACASPEYSEPQEKASYIPPKAPEVQYISGKVIGEDFQRNFADPDRYFFSLLTPDSSIKLITCAGNYRSSQMNALVNFGSNIKLRLESRANSPKPADREFDLCKENLVEIDGIKVDFS